MLAILALLGIGPASFLSKRVGRAARLLLAPVLGMVLGTSVCTTVIWFYPASSTRWLVPSLALMSCVVALRRRPRFRGVAVSRIVIAVLQVLVIAVAVAGPTTYVIADHHSAGLSPFASATSTAMSPRPMRCNTNRCAN